LHLLCHPDTSIHVFVKFCYRFVCKFGHEDAFVVNISSSRLFWVFFPQLISRGRGSRRGCIPRSGSGTGRTGMEKIFPRGDGDGKIIPDGKFSVAILARGSCCRRSSKPMTSEPHSAMRYSPLGRLRTGTWPHVPHFESVYIPETETML
jgi:hypothetical protein